MYMLPPLPRCSSWVYSSLISPRRISLPRFHCRVGLHIVLFEDCSAFTHVAACTLAQSPYIVTAIRGLQTFRHLHACPGCFRRERSPGGPCTHWKAPPCHGARGKPSYSHVVTVSGSGKIVYTAGQLARDVDGNCVGKGDMRAQMEQTFQNLDRCLKAAGATWADVVKTNTFVTDFDEFQKCADIRMRYLGVATPTSTTVGVTRLAGPDLMIEIEAVAIVNS